jgi:hypothetical protein
VVIVDLLFILPLLYLLYHSLIDCKRKKSKRWRFQIFTVMLMGNISNLYYTVFVHRFIVIYSYSAIGVGIKHLGMFLSMYIVFKKASKPITNRQVWLNWLKGGFVLFFILSLTKIIHIIERIHRLIGEIKPNESEEQE